MQAHSQRAGPTQALGVLKADPDPPKSNPRIGQVIEARLKVFGRCSEQDDVSR